MGSGANRERTSHGRTVRDYARLARFLAERPSADVTISLTFGEIEAIIGSPLPPSARFAFWWRNDESLAQARAWLSADWRVAHLDVPHEIVSLTRRASRVVRR